MVSVLSLDTNLRSLLPFVEPTGWCWVYCVNGSSRFACQCVVAVNGKIIPLYIIV